MKRNKKVLIITIIVSFSVLVITIGYYLFNKTEIDNNNITAFYVQEFLEETPESETLLREIDKTTQEFLDIDAYKKGFYFSKFHKRYIKDTLGLGYDSAENDGVKKQYFNEVIMLRLKVLAYQGDIEEYNKLFDTYIYDIENNLYTNVRLASLFISDEKHPVSYDSELFEIIETSFISSYNDCKEVTTKFYLLNEIVEFYSHFDECFTKKEFYRKELVELIKNNRVLLQKNISVQSQSVDGSVSYTQKS